MYICEHCSKQTSAGQPAYFITIETRKKIYPERFCMTPNGKTKTGIIIDNGGIGFETVREIQVCEKCAKDTGGLNALH